MDAVDPTLVSQIEDFAGAVEGVQQVTAVRAHWIGHRLFAELTITAGAQLSLPASHQIAENVAAGLREHIPNLGEVSIHVAPAQEAAAD